MREMDSHAYLSLLRNELAEGRMTRREFLRSATLLGISASAAYGFAGLPMEGALLSAAQADLPKGGTLRIGMAVQDISTPHRYEWLEHNIARNLCEYLTKTGHDNITRPYLLSGWKASDDLKTWTLHLRKDVKWHSGRAFTADDVIWNIEHVLVGEAASSVTGLMQGYLLEEYEEGGEKRRRLWDSNAIEKLDSHTLRLNCKEAQLAVPEHLFHYPFLILDPEEGGTLKPGSNGTGAFELVEHEVGKKSVLRAREDYWGEGPYLDGIEFVDLGEDPGAAINALASQAIHGLYTVDILQLEALKFLPHVEVYHIPTADTAVVRGKVTESPFNHLRVRQAMRLAVDPDITQQIILGEYGLSAEHHHVSPVHPEYAKLPPFRRDVAAAKRLLQEAGYTDGIDIGRIDCKSDPSWEFNAVQAIVEQWKDAGIRCQINLMPASEFWKVWNTTPLGFTEWLHRPLGVMVLELAYRTGVSWNESNYSNADFDRLLSKAGGILDADERRAVMYDLQEILQRDGPIVQPLWRSTMTAMDKRVKGFQMHPTRYIFGNELALET